MEGAKENAGSRRASSFGLKVAASLVAMGALVVVAMLIDWSELLVSKKLRAGQEGRVRIDIVQIENALTDYAVANGGTYPPSFAPLVIPDSDGKTLFEATSIPEDPWKNDYQYMPPRRGETNPTVFSMGADGKRGGKGRALDITNHMINNGEI